MCNVEINIKPQILLVFGSNIFFFSFVSSSGHILLRIMGRQQGQAACFLQLTLIRMRKGFGGNDKSDNMLLFYEHFFNLSEVPSIYLKKRDGEFNNEDLKLHTNKQI